MRYFLLLLIFTISLLGHGQKKKSKLVLKQADRLKAGTYNGEKVNKVIGNVIFKHKKTFLYCDSAIQYLEGRSMDAFGHVRIIDKKTTLKGETLEYNDDTKIAKVRGDVSLKSEEIFLTTKFLDYNMKEKTAYYYNGGKVVENDGATLTSKNGTYYSELDYYFFKDSVTLVKGNDKIISDTLHYYSKSKYAEFFGPTEIFSEDKTLYAEKGRYYTEKDEAYFTQKAKIISEDYILEGDSIYFKSEADYGYAKYNVKITAINDSAIIYGEEAVRYGALGMSKVYGNPYLEKVMGIDTMFLSADTLIAVDDTINKKSNIKAYHDVLIFKPDFQGKCDSLYFSETDSLIHLYKNPVVWNGQNQITADTIKAKLMAGGIDRLYANYNAFIASYDTLDEYNQVKGINMTAYFDTTSAIDFIDVLGNGESIYFARQDDKETGEKKLMGMNKIECVNMNVNFTDNELTDIVFHKQPKARFIPEKNIELPEKKLKGFQWLIKQKPDRYSVRRLQKP